ncbi:GNAT family N-acetyltransferase [Engelhardtia mirabilis]|uniref:Mycothiol acetyltransferase n=1 Tax=Engelhardtia mirabilis TaxID=2528011 RepID=A0A518BNB7_9BACT|nr:Mycothiol acetyltransferase [Planctomycetes bacterium Pla133]QDV02807.1 Mycothiol acetyltransferase [Planctomycetes bacterium Pla86]
MSKIRIRTATRDDAGQIAAWQVAMAAETEDRELPLERVRRGVEAVFADGEKGRYLIAEDIELGRALGSLLLTNEWSDWRDGWFWWIQSVFVESEARGRGIYRRMYEHVLAEAKADGSVCGVRLYVEVENEYAASVYSHLGMDKTSYRMFEVDFAGEAD